MPLSANLLKLESSLLNPTASEANYKPKQRSYGKTKLKKNWGDHSTGGISWGGNSTGGSAGVTILQVILLFLKFSEKNVRKKLMMFSQVRDGG